jgi:uncharacterized membrane protein
MQPAVFYLLNSLAVIAVLASVAIGIWLSRPAATDRNQPQTVVRTASLTPVTGNHRRWWFGLLSTLIPLAATTELLTAHWQTIPPHFPTHWGIHGQPNGWSSRTIPGVFGPLLFVFVLNLSLGLLAELTPRSSPGFQGRSSMIRMTTTVLVTCCWFVTIMICAISLLSLTQNPTRFLPLLMIGAIVFTLGITGYTIYKATHMRSTIAASHNSTDTRFWKAGGIYYNPADPALMVPKRLGFGYTLNFAHPASWLIFAASILLPLLFVHFLHATHPR